MSFLLQGRPGPVWTAAFLLLAAMSGDGHANVDVNIKANIINNTCQITVENSGYVPLPIVSLDYFNSRGNPPSPLLPTDAASGTPFKIRVDDCASWNAGYANRLHFQFRPRSSLFPSGSNQVFINESSEGAENIGVVVFSDSTNKNVLNTDGTSDVVYDIEDKTESQSFIDYLFYVRYQNTGPASAGKVTSNVLVSVNYD